MDLQSVYDTKTRWGAVKELSENTIISVESDGILSVEAIAKDSILAARIANLMVYELNSLNIEIQSSKGGQHVDFLTKRLDEANADLEKALNALREIPGRSYGDLYRASVGGFDRQPCSNKGGADNG